MSETVCGERVQFPSIYFNQRVKSGSQDSDGSHKREKVDPGKARDPLFPP